MFKIAICDDQLICAETLEISVMKIIKELNIPFDISIYTSGNVLLADMKKNSKDYDILFLDIIMNKNELNGMETAKELRSFNEDITIVFVTSSDEFTLEGYSVHAFQYLLKPVNENALRSIFEYTLKNLKLKNIQSNEYVYFRVKESTRKVYTPDIIYIETYGRNTAICLKNDYFLSLNKISDIQKMLDETIFVRCHQSYIVNVNYIKELKHLEIITFNELSIPVSRSQWKNTKQVFLNKQ